MTSEAVSESADGVPAVSGRGSVVRPTSRRGRAAARRRAGRSGRLAPRRRPVRAAAPPRDPGLPLEPASGRPSNEHLQRRRTALLAGIGVLTVVGVGLGVGGLSAVRNSTLGEYRTAAGPSEPGYRASVVRTPTMGVLIPGDDGSLAGAAVLALTPDDAGGSVAVLPPSTVATHADGASSGDEVTLADVYASDGVDGAAEAMAGVLIAAVDQTVELDAATWEQLVAPVGSVEVMLDDPVAEWPAGEVELEPDEVGAFLAAHEDGEGDLARVERQQEFWTAWLAAVRAGGDSALPGEVESGIGRFVRVIAAGEGAALSVPVNRVDGADSADEALFVADAGRLGDFVAATIPWPTSPGVPERISVRLLNGSGDPDLLTEVAKELVAAGAEIDVVGNPDPLDQAETVIVHTEATVGYARWLQSVIDGRLREVAPTSPDGADGDAIDVTVILGQDAGDLLEREQTSD